MFNFTTVEVTQIAIMFLTTISVLFVGLQLREQNRARSNKSYATTIQAIIEMKEWALQQRTITKFISDDPTIFPNKNYAGYDSFETFADFCKLFYHLEYIFHQANSLSISKEDREGLLREVQIWLNVPQAKSYFKNFAVDKNNHSQQFMNSVESFYSKNTNLWKP